MPYSHLKTFKAGLQEGQSNKPRRYGVVLATIFPCFCQTLPCKVAQSQLVFESFLSHLNFPRQSEIRRSVRLREARCIRSEGKHAGTPKVC